MQLPETDRRRAGVVVIGRNEGERLVECLASLRDLGCPLVYVDSGSSDGSLERARPQVEQAIALDPTRPFSAARARNEGFAALRARRPEVEHVQFLDGDCTLIDGWLPAALRAMDADLARAIVVGPLEERRPAASVYNRLCALEWKSPAGEMTRFSALGGIMLVRADAFERLGGFNENVIAGEDSELGVRAGAAGLKVTKIDAPMATHDADIRRFAQWWRRAVRSGHAIGQRFALNGAAGDCARERKSVLFWAGLLPAAIVLLAAPTRGASLLLVLLYLVLGARVARFRRGLGDSPEDARLYARFVVVGKFAEALGLVRFHWNRLAGRYRIIEYK